jgi:hypothetical protein
VLVRLVTILALASVAVARAGAQAWVPEFGVQGGLARLKPAGTGEADHLDALALPGFSLGSDFPAPAGLFAIVPLGGRLALEPGFAASQFSIFGTASAITLALRLDYAVGRHLYGALGAVAGYTEIGGTHDTQLGLQTAIGYRVRLARALTGRLELQWRTLAKTDVSSASNVYTVQIGASAPVGRAVPAAPARATGPGGWRSALGVQGGYASFHIAGVGGVATLAVPGLGGALYPAGGTPVVLPPTLFAIIPLSGRLALEPAADVNRLQGQGTTYFAGNVSTRVNVGLGSRWYVATGGTLQYLKQTNDDAATMLGINTAAGYRFRLADELGGRLEVSYTVMGKDDTFGIASQTFGLMVGVVMPLK